MLDTGSIYFNILHNMYKIRNSTFDWKSQKSSSYWGNRHFKMLTLTCGNFRNNSRLHLHLIHSTTKHLILFCFCVFFKTKKHCCLQESFPEYWQLNLKFFCPVLEKVFFLSFSCSEKKTITPPTIRHQSPRPYFDIFDFQYVQVFQMPRKEWVAKKDIECSLVTFLFELIVIFMGCDFQFLKILA